MERSEPRRLSVSAAAAVLLSLGMPAPALAALQTPEQTQKALAAALTGISFTEAEREDCRGDYGVAYTHAELQAAPFPRSIERFKQCVLRVREQGQAQGRALAAEQAKKDAQRAEAPAALTAILADFPYTKAERGRCDISYRFAADHASDPRTDAGIDHFGLCVEDFKECVLRERAGKKSAAEREETAIRAATLPHKPVVFASQAEPPAPKPKKPARQGPRRPSAAESAAADAAFCGDRPERAWDSYVGAEDAIRDVAVSPRSVDVGFCSEVVREPPPACWIAYCKYEAKNAFGVEMRGDARVSKSSIGWRVVK